jgi:hypothetical protein
MERLHQQSRDLPYVILQLHIFKGTYLAFEKKRLAKILDPKRDWFAICECCIFTNVAYVRVLHIHKQVTTRARRRDKRDGRICAYQKEELNAKLRF